MKANALIAKIEINAPIEKVWALWSNPEDIKQWNNMSADWHTTSAENDLAPGGRFLYVMALRDGSFHFDFSGTYDEVKINDFISYTLDNGRRTENTFTGINPVTLTEVFEPDETQPLDMQRDFCQAVLDSFKAYVESKA